MTTVRKMDKLQSCRVNMANINITICRFQSIQYMKILHDHQFLISSTLEIFAKSFVELISLKFYPSKISSYMPKGRFRGQRGLLIPSREILPKIAFNKCKESYEIIM